MESGTEQHPFDQAMLDRGTRLGELIRSTQEWVTRRIERVEFEDGWTFRRVTTFDVSFDVDGLQGVPRWRGRLLLPLKALKREHDVDATVLDATGVALPQLTFRHERSLLAAAIVSQVLPGSADDGVRVGVAREVYKVIRQDAWELADFDEACRELEASLPSGTPVDGALRSALARHANVGAKWGKRWVIACPADLTDDQKGDQEGCLFRLQVAQSERLPQDPEYHNNPLTLVRDALLREPDNLALPFDVEELGECESLHFELSVPAGVLVKSTDAYIGIVTRGELGRWDPEGRVLPAISVVVRCNDDPHHDRAARHVGSMG